MVRARYPAGILSLHACSTHEDVLNGFIEHVAHVEHTRHVGGRNHHGVGLPVVGLRGEEVVVGPILVPLSFHVLGVVSLC